EGQDAQGDQRQTKAVADNTAAAPHSPPPRPVEKPTICVVFSTMLNCDCPPFAPSVHPRSPRVRPERSRRLNIALSSRPIALTARATQASTDRGGRVDADAARTGPRASGGGTLVET